MSETKKTLLIAAAGTGGHVMPGLAVARIMQQRGWDITWVGTKTGMEGRLVSREKIVFEGLNFQGVRGKGLFGAIKGAFKLIGAFFSARRLVEKVKPQAFFSTGGYIAVPVGYAVKMKKIPMILMNCDADLLMSTNTLLPICDALACGFAGGARSFAKQKGHTTGNPVRREILAIPAPKTRLLGREGVLKVLVFGGSLGAKVFNDVVPEFLASLPENVRPQVVHQTGKDRDEAVREQYAQLGVQAQVLPFIDNMAERYQEADVVICRAGATSISELCAAGVASILVPFVAKTTSHQVGNARYMQENGASVMIENGNFNAETLKAAFEKLSRERLLEMSENAHRIAKRDAAEKVADLIEKVVEKTTPRI